MSRFYDDDSPELPYGIKLYRKYKEYPKHFSLMFIGLIIWTFSFLIMQYYRDFLVTYFKSKEDRGYYYKLIEYKESYKRVSVFTFFLIVLTVTVFFLDQRDHILFSGFILFFILYLMYLMKHYYLDGSDFDYLDDAIYLYKKLLVKKGKEKQKTE
jgi:hypothetical protein